MASAIDLSVGTISRTRHLPLQSKLSLLGRKVLRRAGIPARSPMVIRVGEGQVWIDPAHEPDWSVFFTVFVEEHYRTDFEDAIALDVGAHRGCFLAYALENGAASVDAYEPEPSNHAALARVAESYGGAPRATVHRGAVGARGGRASLIVSRESWAHSLWPSIAGEEPTGQIDVDVIAFSDIVERNAAAAPGKRVIVKLDAEGVEFDVVAETALETLARIDELLVEVHPVPGHSTTAFVARLASAGLARVDEMGDELPVVMRFVRS